MKLVISLATVEELAGRWRGSSASPCAREAVGARLALCGAFRQVLSLMTGGGRHRLRGRGGGSGKLNSRCELAQHSPGPGEPPGLTHPDPLSHTYTTYSHFDLSSEES